MASVCDKDYYEILGVRPDAPPASVKLAYRSLVLHVHPDKNESRDATEAFQQLQNAYETLHDPVRRSRYDSCRQNSGLVKSQTSSAQNEGGAGQAKAGWQRLNRLTALQAEWARLMRTCSEIDGNIKHITTALRESQEIDLADLQEASGKQGLWRRIVGLKEPDKDRRARHQQRLGRLHDRRIKEFHLEKHKAQLNHLVQEVASIGSQIYEAERLIKAQQAAMEQKRRKAQHESEQMQALDVEERIQEYKDMKRRAAAARRGRQAGRVKE